MEPHTAAKHDLLKHYLDAWFPILASSERRIIFLDGFAGPGIYENGKPGSPIIALRTLLDHDSFDRFKRCEFIFHFIEKDPERVERLEIELERFGSPPSNVIAGTHLGEFQDYIEAVTNSLREINAELAPTLAFVDPFGVSDVPMELISRFLNSPKCELVLILMVDHLNRFLGAEHMRSGRDSLFGTSDFSEVEAALPGERIPLLVALYERQLRGVANFQFALNFEMKRDNGTVAYYIVYATRNMIGVEKFKDAMWKVDPSTGTTFSDRSWNQGQLFTGSNVDLGPLQQQLRNRFEGETVSIERLEEFTLLETSFRKAHVRSALKPMEKQGNIHVVRPTGSRSGFPPGTQVRFIEGLGI